MKLKEIQELKNKAVGELENLLVEKRKKLHELNLDLAAGKVKNIGELREVKKYIARVMTFLNQSKSNQK